MSLEQLEARLVHRLPEALRSRLNGYASQALRETEQSVFREDPFFDEWFHRFFMRPPDHEWYQYSQAGDVFRQLIEYRQERFARSPELQETQERAVAAARVVFRVRIEGYSSLTLGIGAGPWKALARVFENYEALEIFLDAFMPSAFAEVFNQTFTEQLQFEVLNSRQIEKAFRAEAGQVAAQRASVPQAPSGGADKSDADSRIALVWRLWLVANGSLLVPVLLTIAVAYYGMVSLAETQKKQQEVMKPVLEHQTKLLETYQKLFESAAGDTSQAKK